MEELAARTATGCARCGAALESDDLRCPVCGLATPPRPRLVRAEQVVVVRCESCRASVSYSAEAQAPKCAYCGSVMRLETPEDPVEQAQAFLPFTVDAQAARAALARFLRRKAFFRPSDLAARATLDSLEPMWWPAWVFNARALVSWTADSDAGAREASWAPHAGQNDLLFRDVLVSASRGLTPEECTALAAASDLGLAAEKPKGPSEARIERFDAARSGARRRIAEAVETLARAKVAATEVPGSRKRNLKVAVQLSGLETARYALPAWVLAWRYREKLYRLVISGQDAGCVVGRAPVSPWRVLAAVGIGALLVAAGVALASWAVR